MRCAVLVVALAACYHPNYEDCQLSCSTFGCPDGLTCQGGMCRTADAVGECAILPQDGGIDGDGDGSGSAGGATQIVAGAHHACAACGDGSLWCWGDDSYGQTSGTGQAACNPNDPTSTCNPTPVPVQVTGTLEALGAGRAWTCAFTDVSGTTKQFCMGDNALGEFGLASPAMSSTLIDTGITGATAYAGGGQHACEVVGGRVECQGSNQLGQLGNGNAGQTMPIPMATTPEVIATQLAAGQLHTCAAAPNTSPWCWGDNSHGEVTGTTGNVVTQPRQIAAFIASEVAAGAGHTCMLNSDGVRCWGKNDVGQVGNSATSTTAPITLIGLSGVSHIAAAGTQTCALTQDGIVDCWGGVDAASSHNSPTQVQLPMAATAIAVGTGHVCAILRDRSVWCWGSNLLGELGTGTADAQMHGPSRVPVCE